MTSLEGRKARAAKLARAIAGGLRHEAGQVIRPNGKVVPATRDRDGYYVINVGCQVVSRARVICWICHGPPFEGAEVDHINRIRDDDRPENLRWVTKAENLKQRVTANQYTKKV